jgi:hypothetical protein
MAIKNLNKLADRLKGVKVDGQELTAEKLQEIMTSEDEVEIETDPVHVFTDDEKQTLENNMKKDGYNEGKTAGSEMTIKEIKQMEGLDFEGKTADKLVENLRAKIQSDAQKKPNEQVEEWKQSYNQLKKTYETEKQALNQQLQSLQSEKKDIEITEKLKQGFGKLNNIDAGDAALIAKNTYNFDFDDNGNVIVKNGNQTLKNNVGEPRDYREVLTELAQYKNWLEKDGRGGGNSTGGGNGSFKTKQDLFRYMEKEGIEPDSQQGQEMITKFEQDHAQE